MTPVLKALGPLASAFAVAIVRTDRHLVRRLRAAGAVDQGSAVGIALRTPLHRWRLARLMSAGAVQRTTTGYFLEEKGFAAFRRGRRRRLLSVVLAAALFAAARWFFGG
jgi:hypothetical protein